MKKPSAYDNLLAHLEKLPGIGKRSAERIAFHLLRQPEADTLGLADAVRAFRENLRVCSVTGHVSESDPCSIVTDPSRDHGTILVVEQPSDVIALEQTGAYRGSYHVLMGRLAPLEAISPGQLNIDGLLERVANGQRSAPAAAPGTDGTANPRITEVILGTNPTLEGDGTALYLADRLQAMGVKVTRLARGLPTGSNLQTVSKAVLSDAVQGRVSDF
ncbi:MAG: recombination mediator RecR [Planctomycetota bacterium]